MLILCFKSNSFLRGFQFLLCRHLSNLVSLIISSLFCTSDFPPQLTLFSLSLNLFRTSDSKVVPTISFFHLTTHFLRKRSVLPPLPHELVPEEPCVVWLAYTFSPETSGMCSILSLDWWFRTWPLESDCLDCNPGSNTYNLGIVGQFI